MKSIQYHYKSCYRNIFFKPIVYQLESSNYHVHVSTITFKLSKFRLALYSTCTSESWKIKLGIVQNVP